MARRRTPPKVPDWPVVEIVLHDDTFGTIRGRQIRAPRGGDVLPLLLAEACTIARSCGRPVRTRIESPTGQAELVASPNGQTDFISATPRPASAAPALDAAPSPATSPAAGRGAASPARPDPDVARDPAGAFPSTPAALVPVALPPPGPAPWPHHPGPAQPPHVRTSGSTRRRRALPSVLGVIAAVATASLIAVLLTGPADSRGTGRRSRPSATTAAVPTPTITAVPPGFASLPAWAVPIAAWTRSAATGDGIVLTRDPAGHVLLLDPSTGRTRWTSRETTTRDQTGPWPATIDGARAAALISPGRLTYWPLPATPATTPAPTRTGVSVPLPPDTTVTWTGPAPLVQLPDHTAAVIRAGALLTVPLPPGAVALAAGDTGVLAATPTSWILQPASTAPVPPRALPRPDGAGSTPLRVEAVGTSYLLTIWPTARGSGQVVTLMDVATGSNVVRTEVTAAADLRNFTAVRETGGTQLAIGPVVVDTYLNKIDLLDMTYVVKALTRGHAWTLHDSQPVDLRLSSTGDFHRFPFAGAGDDSSLPIGVSRLPTGEDRPVLVAPAGTGRMLCGLRQAR